ncbi:replication-relaxation family protein [Kitasatospora sp. NPDC048540]|uniref:replication-relaxation family protein n=1 Tax=unclassified Kitasatospora TaxID=2633591 RepID=UPI00053B1D38|nr:replication-relaxation family protein [Kitasatospora sp. MBT63]
MTHQHEPTGPTDSLREDILTALGILKIATDDQLHRLLRPHLGSGKSIRAALLDLQLNGLTVPDGNTTAQQRTWRLNDTDGPSSAAHLLLELVRGEAGGATRGAGRTGASHTMAVNETIVAFVRGGGADGAGGVGRVTSWSTETEFTLPGGRRKVRPDAVLQAPEIGVPELLVEVGRSTMPPAPVAASFPACPELFRRRVRNRPPTAPGGAAAGWRQAHPGHTRDGCPPIALVVTDAGSHPLTDRLKTIYDLCRKYCPPRRRREDGDDGWDRHDDTIPVIATTLELLQQHGPMGEVWRRYGRNNHGLSLPEALEDRDAASEQDGCDRTRGKEVAAENRPRIEKEGEGWR